MQSEPQLDRALGGGVQKEPPVCLAQGCWVVVFGPVESVVPSLGTIAKQDNWYSKINRKCSYHNIIIFRTQKSRIDVPLCLHFLTFVAY